MTDIKKQTRKQWPLWVQLAVALVIGTLIASIFGDFVIRKFESEYFLANSRQQSQKTFELFTVTVIDALIAEDKPILDSIVEQAVIIDPNIYSLKITNEKGAALSSWKQPKTLSVESLISFNKDIVFEGETFGQIMIEWDTSYIQKDIAKIMKAIRLFTMTIFTLLLVILIYCVFRLVIQPINKIDRRLIQMADGDLSSQLKISASRELVHLADSVNKLVKTTVSKKYVDSILKSMLDSLIVLNPEGKIISVNQATLNLLGYKEQELIGKPFDLILNHQEEEFKIFGINQLMKQGFTRNVERIYLAKDGREIPVFFSGSVIHNVEGTIDGVVCIAQDITEQKQSDEFLRQSEKSYRSLVETVPHGIEETDAFGIITFANSSLYKMYEYGERELIGKSILDIVATDSEREELRDYLVILVKEQPPPVPYSGKKRTKKGGIIDVQVDWNYKRDEQGRVIGFVSIITDITARKRAEESRKRLTALLEATPDFVGFGSAKDKRILYINEAGRKMVGLEPDVDVTKMKITDFHPAKDNELIFKKYMPAVIRDGIWKGEVMFLHRDGHEIPTSMVLVAHKSPSGEVEYFSTISRDITAQKQAEKTLAKMARFPEFNPGPVLQLSLDGTVSRANPAARQLFQKKPLEGKSWFSFCHCVERNLFDQMIKNRGQFQEEIRCIENKIFLFTFKYDEEGNYIYVYGTDITEREQHADEVNAALKEKEVLLKEIHHRVKNNLQVITSLLNLQSEKIKDEHSLEMFKDSQNRVKSMALIHEKLYQSKNFSKINFADYIRNLSSYLFHSYGSQTQDINLKVNANKTMLSLNAAMPCGLIINELVSNSLKHAFPNGRKGKISIDLVSHNDHNLTLIVRDNGVGFPKGLDFKKTQSLGLQLVNTLTKQLSGTIELNRRNGTEFKILFHG